jgi:hypothetical protein
MNDKPNQQFLRAVIRVCRGRLSKSQNIGNVTQITLIVTTEQQVRDAAAGDADGEKTPLLYQALKIA